MALKNTAEKKDRKPNFNPRRVNVEDESRSTDVIDNEIILLGRRKTKKLRDASTTAIVNPTIIHPTPTIYQSYLPPFSVAYPSAMPIVSTMSPYAPPSIITSYPYPDTIWNTFFTMPVPNPIYSVPMPTLPVTLFSPIAAPVYPYTAVIHSPVLIEPPMAFSSPLAGSVASSDYFFNRSFESALYEQTDLSTASANTTYSDEITKKLQNSPVKSRDQVQPLDPEDYFSLPRDLFPTARTLAVDPNPIIDQFCRLLSIEKHSPWILDLEFGVPKQPVVRPIATYDVQFNSIHCKNTPGAIHPGFESCSPDFKRVFLFYYDCVISSWYKGYILMYNDRSVANFQSWLQVPMQMFGIGWP